MTTFKVWDELNGCEQDAHDIEAFDAEEAAVKYASVDTDGLCDGLYVDSEQPIMVRDDAGRLTRFHVEAEMAPRFSATAEKV